MSAGIMKQIIVMRKDLNMRKGKMVAQGAHASMAHIIATGHIQEAWLMGGMSKICVGVDSEEQLLDVERQAKEAGLLAFLITDAGHTEFGGQPTRTCVAIGPGLHEDIDKITGNLKLL